ncbi:MAG TPA: FeoA domain-containing protein [Bdellovibrionales bacterium]|nr:FeoA domain-containing protein [Bdellovibrionales bacterium]
MAQSKRTLLDIEDKQPFSISELAGDAVLVSRLREIGFNRGELVQVTGRAPFGEPLLVEIRGATVALRKEEARCVIL